MTIMHNQSIIDEKEIQRIIETHQQVDPNRILEILDKGKNQEGLTAADVAALCSIKDPELIRKLHDAAKEVKQAIYGKRLVVFAPMYISNHCSNECLYCAFRAQNRLIRRKSLDMEEIRHETKILVDQGHKRILLVTGETHSPKELSYVMDAISTIYSVQSGHGAIRRINVNIAPLTVESFRELKKSHIGTYQIFQETYHRETYRSVHTGGWKKDYDWRIEAPQRAMEAGIDDVGIGVLFGLYDFNFEMVALMKHIAYLEDRFGTGPHTISVPRLEPAHNSSLSDRPPQAGSDGDFKKIVAILRLAVPYTGIIMSTRENAAMRRATLSLGVSQISAGSRTNPGGYETDEFEEESSQFSLGDHRSLEEVIQDVASMGYIPSFCTGCYRRGRTGRDFMDLAKPGLIRRHCDPNGIATFLEYLLDYASEKTRLIGEKLIEREISTLTGPARSTAEILVEKIRNGKRDVFS